MTKAIMQEIRGDHKVEGVYQPKHGLQSRHLLASINNNADDSIGKCLEILTQFSTQFLALYSFSHSTIIPLGTGIKFKLVKSNSCSSRLELAGTGLDEEQLRNNQLLMQGIHYRNADDATEAEESVRTLVSRLEFGQVQPKSKPRIIESRCIEKHTEPVRSAQQQEQSPLQEPPAAQSADEMARLKPVADLIAQVTVNNHISFASPALVKQQQQQQKKATAKEEGKSIAASNTSGGTSTATTTKLVRNRNVDLAINMSAAHAAKETKEKPKGATTTTTTSAVDVVAKLSNSAAAGSGASVNSTAQVCSKNAKNLINNERSVAGNAASSTSVSAASMPKAMPSSSSQSSAAVNEAAENIATDATATRFANSNTNGGSAARLVKWNTLSKFDEKNYVTNDAKLKLKPKYDEIEFEEFEVFDPSNPQNNNNSNSINNAECYDSLNEK